MQIVRKGMRDNLQEKTLGLSMKNIVTNEMQTCDSNHICEQNFRFLSRNQAKINKDMLLRSDQMCDI